jgi:uncharacterized protein (DUF1697 family)
MLRLFVFLRAVNASRDRALHMNALRDAVRSLGFADVHTYLGSGNVILDSTMRDTAALEKRIERGLGGVLGMEMTVFIRTARQIRRIEALLQLSEQARGADLNVILLRQALSASAKAKVVALNSRTDEFVIQGREILWTRRKKPGTSLYATVPLGRVISQPFTVRSANTINCLIDRWL